MEGRGKERETDTERDEKRGEERDSSPLFRSKRARASCRRGGVVEWVALFP